MAIDHHHANMQLALGNALVELHRAEEAPALLADGEEVAKHSVDAIRSVRQALERTVGTLY